MPSSPLLVFDFDGVLVDGMAEYWWSARRAAEALAADRPGAPLCLPEQAPAGFARLRPLIHKGWEMVLMAAELGRPDFDLDDTLAHYDHCLAEALQRWGWDPAQLQWALEAVRSEAIATDLPAWLALHRFYPGVVERLGSLEQEGADWAVLTTKGGAFAARLLAAAGLTPARLFGHEQGSKPEVLRQLVAEAETQGEVQGETPARPLWFFEDRRPTLELVRATPGLERVRCYLVSWGYLAPRDGEGLETAGIRWLDPERFASPLAQWP
ncbi:MAG TPA: HAD family hydrolase [Cyanobium sp.]|nr:HAD family hydrolase [Cyanobium sp.]